MVCSTWCSVRGPENDDRDGVLHPINIYLYNEVPTYIPNSTTLNKMRALSKSECEYPWSYSQFFILQLHYPFFVIGCTWPSPLQIFPPDQMLLSLHIDPINTSRPFPGILKSAHCEFRRFPFQFPVVAV